MASKNKGLYSNFNTVMSYNIRIVPCDVQECICNIGQININCYLNLNLTLHVIKYSVEKKSPPSLSFINTL